MPTDAPSPEDEASAAWRGDDYDRISEPHAAMGSPALERLELAGHERVLDAGCGSGRLTERLLERLPQGRVVALDGFTSMLAEAAQRLARFGDRICFVQADPARPPLPIAGHVDAVLSTATVHWIVDHDALFEGLRGVLIPAGRLSFQCGGQGNAAALIEAARAEGVETAHLLHMGGVEGTTRRLEAHGFVAVEAWLQSQTIHFETRAALLDCIVTPYVRPATGLPDDALYALAGAMADRLGVLAIDYVRLNVTARKG